MADIILKDRDGNDVNYSGVNSVVMESQDGGTQSFVTGEFVEKTIDPDFSAGDMEVIPEEGTFFSKVTVQKPETLIPENVAEGVDIAGIIGTLAAGGGVSNICMATYEVGFSYEATNSSVTLIPKEDLDEIGFGSATKKFAIMFSTRNTVGVYNYYMPICILQTNYALSSSGGSSLYAYGNRTYNYKRNSSATYSTVTSSCTTSSLASNSDEGWMRYNNNGLQYYGGSKFPLYYNTYFIIAGVIS